MITVFDLVNHFDIFLVFPYLCFRDNWYPHQLCFYIYLPSAVLGSFHSYLALVFQFKLAISLFVLEFSFVLPQIFYHC